MEGQRPPLQWTLPRGGWGCWHLGEARPPLTEQWETSGYTSPDPLLQRPENPGSPNLGDGEPAFPQGAPIPGPGGISAPLGGLAVAFLLIFTAFDLLTGG